MISLKSCQAGHGCLRGELRFCRLEGPGSRETCLTFVVCEKKAKFILSFKKGNCVPFKWEICMLKFFSLGQFVFLKP